MAKLLTNRKRKVAAIVAGVLGVLYLLAMGAYFYFGEHALPGTTVAGENVGGKTRSEIAEQVEARFEATEVKLVGEEEEQALPAADLGVEVDAEATAEKAFPHTGDGLRRFREVFSPKDIEPIVTVDQKAFDKAISGLDLLEEEDQVNGKAKFSKKEQKFVASPGRPGQKLDREALSKDVAEGAEALQTFSVSLETVEVEPDYAPKVIEAAAKDANEWLALEIVTETRGDEPLLPQVEQKAKWISFEATDDDYKAVLDEKKIEEWVKSSSEAAYVEPVEGVRNVNESGKVVSVATEGSDGWKVTNSSRVQKEIVEALKKGEPYYGSFEYEKLERKWTEKLIADGAEDLVYQAAPGEKWIDIDLAKHKVITYEGATKIMQSPMVSAAPEYSNAVGEYAIWAKIPTQTMRGDNYDGTTYETENVPWILYYHGSYALHGAYWRSQFGMDAGSGGSHGCINLPVDRAKKIYDWASVGTKVVAHY